MSKVSEFRFKKTDNVGAPGAEEDEEFLKACFVDTGDLKLLMDTSDRRVIVLGRTGAGKTALVRQLDAACPGRVISIKPDNLALTYIANSNVLNFFTDLGINLDPFYKLLWRHVFTVEILTRFFHEHSVVQKSPSLFDKIRAFIVGEGRQENELRLAVDYLEEWGRSFWGETEFRVKEITQKVETELRKTAKVSVGKDIFGAGADQAKASTLSEEQRAEIVRRGQEVVSATQVRDLHQVFPLIDKVLSDKQRAYYVVLDGLDENWVEARLRYKLIMGLILTAREFVGVKNVKIVVALRKDLIERVFRLARDSGFQEEKYQGLYLPLTWTKNEILTILERRVNHMVKRRYTKQPVGYKDLLPKTYRGRSIGDFIYSIANRPRDVIALFNECIQTAIDETGLSEADFTKAIATYSRSRLHALADEWHADYPDLQSFTKILDGRPPSFKAGTITPECIEDMCLDVVANNPGGEGLLNDSAKSLVDEILSSDEMRATLLHVMYRIGLVGLKTRADMAESWTDGSGQAVSRRHIDNDTSVIVAPKYAAALGIEIRE